MFGPRPGAFPPPVPAAGPAVPPASAAPSSQAPPSSQAVPVSGTSQTPSAGEVLAAALTGKGKDGADEEQGIARWFSQAGPPPAAGAGGSEIDE